MKTIFKVIVLSILLIFCLLHFSQKKQSVTLKFASWGSQSETTVIKKLLKEFEEQNKKDNLKVEFINAPSNYFVKLHLYFAAKMAPDVVFINNIYFPKYYEAGLLEDLTPYFEKELNQNIYFSSSTNGFMRNNKIYAIPRDVSNIVIYYNKSLFDRYKTTYPKQNWTLQELETIAKKMTKDVNGDGKIDIWGINRNDKMIFWLPFLTVSGGSIIDENNKPIIANKNSIRLLQRYCDYVNVSKISPADSQLSGKTHAQLFMNGQLAMYVGGRWNVPKFSQITDFDWDIINFPSQITDIIPADASGWAISKNSKQKKYAVKLIKFLSSKYAIEKITRTGLITPARKDVAFADTFLKFLSDKNSEVFIYATEHSKPQKLNKNIKEIEDVLSNELQPAFNGSKTVEECLKNEFTVKKLYELSKPD